MSNDTTQCNLQNTSTDEYSNTEDSNDEDSNGEDSSTESSNGEVSETISSQVTSTQSIVGLTGSAIIISSFLSFSSPIGIWLIINQFQLFYLLLFIGVFIPKDIKDFILGMEFMSFSLNFIPFNKLPFVEYVVKLIDSEQTDSNLKDIGAQSRSAFINNFGLIIFMLLLLILHLIYLLVYSLCKG